MNYFIDTATLGSIIRKYRKLQNLTQAEVASRSNMNETYISAIECGYSAVSIPKYLTLCEGMGVDPLVVMKEYMVELSGQAKTPEDDENNPPDFGASRIRRRRRP